MGHPEPVITGGWRPTWDRQYKVGIIGSGVVGQTFGFLKYSHEIEIGTRYPAKLKD